jgi:hypothetical protein
MDNLCLLCRIIKHFCYTVSSKCVLCGLDDDAIRGEVSQITAYDSSMGAAIMSDRRRHTDQGGISACSFSKSLDIERYFASHEKAEQIEVDAGAYCCSSERLVTA